MAMKRATSQRYAVATLVTAATVFATALCGMASAADPYRSPGAIVAGQDGQTLYVAEITANAGGKYDAEVCRAATKLVGDGILRMEQDRLVCSL